MPRTRTAPFVFLLACALALLAAPVRAAGGKLVVVETFAAGDAELMVAHYTDPDVEPAKARVGLIAIASPGRNSFAFDHPEWLRLIELCDKAAAVESATWTRVGMMTETGTTDVSQLTISAGPGVSFVISSPQEGTVSFIVAKADLARLRKGMRQVRDYLARY